MTHATLLWSIWLALLAPFACAFSRRGYRRFVEWITALAINVEEHTVTQSVLAVERPADWKAMESFAEYGAWNTDMVTWSLNLLIDKAPGRTSQAQWVTLSLLRLAQFRLESAGEVDWWFRPPWNKDKDRPSVLDLERLMRRHRGEIQQFLSEWLGDEEKTKEDVA